MQADQRKPNFELHIEKTTLSSPQSQRKDLIDGFKRPSTTALVMGQLKTREHLINLLTASGLRVGLPKSSSVRFFEITT